MENRKIGEIMSKNIWIINHYAIPPSLGGLNRHYYFAKHLINRGYNVRIITSSAIHNTNVNIIEDKNTFYQEKEMDGIVYTYIRTSSYKGNGIKRIKNMFEFALKIKKCRKIFKEKPDVIYTSSPDLFTAYFAEKLAKKLKVPCVVEIRDLWPLSIVEYKGISSKNPAITALYRMEKSIYKKADAIVFTMEGGRDYIVDKGWDKQINLDKIYNINNGVDLELFEKNKLENPFCDIDLDDDNIFKVVYVGSIRKVNNIKLLIDCAQKMQTVNKQVKFIVFGDGNEKELLENYCNENNIDNIVFKGFVNKKFVPDILTKADINIINVQQTDIMKYGCSLNKLFDYLAAGKPIVSNLKVNYDLIKKYNCGITTDNQNSDTMMQAIQDIFCLSEEKYKELCINAKNGATDYDFEKLTNKLEDVIKFVEKEV